MFQIAVDVLLVGMALFLFLKFFFWFRRRRVGKEGGNADNQ